VHVRLSVRMLVRVDAYLLRVCVAACLCARRMPVHTSQGSTAAQISRVELECTNLVKSLFIPISFVSRVLDAAIQDFELVVKACIHQGRARVKCLVEKNSHMHYIDEKPTSKTTRTHTRTHTYTHSNIHIYVYVHTYVGHTYVGI